MSRVDAKIVRQMPCALGAESREARHGKGVAKMQWLGLWTCADCVRVLLGFRQQLDADDETAWRLETWR